jgi:hypothetical protein
LLEVHVPPAAHSAAIPSGSSRSWTSM